MIYTCKFFTNQDCIAVVEAPSRIEAARKVNDICEENGFEDEAVRAADMEPFDGSKVLIARIGS